MQIRTFYLYAFRLIRVENMEWKEYLIRFSYCMHIDILYTFCNSKLEGGIDAHVFRNLMPDTRERKKVLKSKKCIFLVEII